MIAINSQHKLLETLVNSKDENHAKAVLYAVYKTIAANPAITLNKLVWVLNIEFMVAKASVEAAVVSLKNKAYYDGIKTWHTKHAVILNARPEFEDKIAEMEAEMEELKQFVPPKVKVKAQ